MEDLTEKLQAVKNLGEIKDVLDEIEEKSRDGRIISRVKDLKWTRYKWGGRMARVMYPQMGFNIQDLAMFILDIPGGKSAPAHKHNCEAIKYFLRGKGYETIDGKKYEVEAGDAVLIPPNTWHFTTNTDPKKTLAFIATYGRLRVPMLDAMMIGKE